MPAVLYGQKDNVSFTINPKILAKIIKQKGKNVLIDLQVEDDSVKNRKVLLKDFQTHPLRETWVHADFLEVDVSKNIRVRVPVKLTGLSPGEKQGGILNHIIRELDMECLPGDIPEEVTVSIENLQLGEFIRISDLPLFEKFKIHNASNAPIVTVHVEKEEAKEAEEDEAVAEETTATKTSENKEPAAEEGKSDKK